MMSYICRAILVELDVEIHVENRFVKIFIIKAYIGLYVLNSFVCLFILANGIRLKAAQGWRRERQINLDNWG